ncbi:unnamed protein product [Bathycoccus prasinos]
MMEEAEDEATENTTSTTTTGTPPPPPAMMMIPTFANARNRALDEAIAEHAEQVLKREKDACRHANRAYLMKQHQKDVGKALGRLEIHLQEYSRLKENEKERLANARLEKVRTERERKKRESAIEEEKELQIHLKKRITHERFALEQLNEEHERQKRNADVWEKRREVVNAFEHRAEERDHFMEKQEREHEKCFGELSKKLRVAMENFESADVERLAEIASRKGLTRDLREAMDTRKALFDRLRDAELGLERREKEKRAAVESKGNAELVLNESKRRLTEDIQPKRLEHEKRRKTSEGECEKTKRMHTKSEDTREMEKNKLKETKKQWEYQKRALKQASDVAHLANEKLSLTKQTLRDHAKRLEAQKESHIETLTQRSKEERKKQTATEKQAGLEVKRKEFLKTATKAHDMAERDATRAREEANEKSRKLQTMKAFRAGAHSQKQNAEELLKQNTEAEKRTNETILQHAFRVNCLRRKFERKEGVLPEAGVSSEQFEMLQKKVRKLEETVSEAKKEHDGLLSAEKAVEETLNKARLSARESACERDRFEKDCLANAKSEATAAERWSNAAEDSRDDALVELHILKQHCGKEANKLLEKDDSCDRLFANELTLKDSFREELASCERERKEVVNVKLKEILKEKSMLVKVANQTELERDNAKSRYEKVLLVAPYPSETNARVVEDDGDGGDSQQQRRRREAMHETAQQSILKEQARIKELNARLFRTKRDTDRLSAAIEDVEKSNLALMHRIRGKSLEKSPDALKREQKVKEAKETQKGAESRLRDAKKIQSHALRSAKKNYERAIESERGKKERLDRASNIEKKLLSSLRSLAKSSAKKADLVFASEAKIKTMETRTDVRDAVRVLRNAISSSSSLPSSSSKKTKTKKQEESTSPPAYTNKHLAVQAVLNAAVPAREGTSFASSLKWSGKYDDDQSSLHSSESFLLQRV